jgi:hypothetical protein
MYNFELRRNTLKTYDKWVTPCLTLEPDDESIDHGPVGYRDFNLDAPNVGFIV